MPSKRHLGPDPHLGVLESAPKVAKNPNKENVTREVKNVTLNTNMQAKIREMRTPKAKQNETKKLFQTDAGSSSWII